nr:MAG TPA: hypothetical protein [Caudoviricetes sp.]
MIITSNRIQMPLPLTITIFPAAFRRPSFPADQADPFYLRGSDRRLTSVPPPDRLPQLRIRTHRSITVGRHRRTMRLWPGAFQYVFLLCRSGLCRLKGHCMFFFSIHGVSSISNTESPKQAS